jgi:hypothetical protein
VSRNQWHEHREGGGDAPNEVVAAKAHPSSGSTCGSGGGAALSHGGGGTPITAAPVAGFYSTGGEGRR